MIITVTMNPAIDKTVEVDSLIPGDLNRIKKTERDVGGKGINVSKTLRELGMNSTAMGFLAGSAGKMIEKTLDDLGISHDFVWTEGETRTNTKVIERNGDVTELNESGPEIKKSEADELMNRLEKRADHSALFVLAGSIPQGVSEDIYGEIIRCVHKKGARVLLDADGEVFRRAVLAEPDIVKPNRKEFQEYNGICREMSDVEICSAAQEMCARGVGTVLVSLGREGAVMVKERYTARCRALPVKAHSTVGAGDAMAAALAYAWEKNLGNEETFRLCMAVSAGAVTTVGTKPPDRKLVDRLMGIAEPKIIEIG